MKDSDSILYFPSIEINDSNWLKANTLLWGRIYRICPNGYHPSDSDDVKQLIDAGIVSSLSPSKGDLSDTYDDYLNFINGLPSLPDGLDDYNNYDNIHIDKIDARLYPILEKFSKKLTDGFLQIPSHLARGYMLYLANSIAERRNLNMATSSADAWVTSAYINEKGNFSEFVYGAKDEGEIRAYATVSLSDLLPTNLEGASIKQVIDFALRHKDEKEALRQSVTEFLNELRLCKEPDHAEYIIEKHIRNLNAAKQDYQKSTGFLSRDTLRSSMVIGVPALYTVLGAMTDLLGKDYYINYSSALLIGFGAAMIERNFTSSQSKNAVGNILLSMEKELAQKKTQPNFSYIFDQFIND